MRPSGTEPVIRVMGEGDDKALVEEVVDDIVAALSQAPRRSDSLVPRTRGAARKRTHPDSRCLALVPGLQRSHCVLRVRPAHGARYARAHRA